MSKQKPDLRFGDPEKRGRHPRCHPSCGPPLRATSRVHFTPPIEMSHAAAFTPSCAVTPAPPRRVPRKASPSWGRRCISTNASPAEELPPTDWAKEYRASFDEEDSEAHGKLANFMNDCGQILGGVDTRFIVIGDAILESVVPFPKSPRFAVLGAKGTCCTFASVRYTRQTHTPRSSTSSCGRGRPASDDKTFEAHVFLKTIKSVALARSEQGGRKIYAVRFFGEEAKEGEAPARPKLTYVLHAGENGEVPETAVEAWEKVAEKLK